MTQTILLMLIYAHHFQVIKHSIKTSLRFVFFASPTPPLHRQVSEGRGAGCAQPAPHTGHARHRGPHPRLERAKRQEEEEEEDVLLTLPCRPGLE